MAFSKCVACNSSSFEIKLAEPRGGQYKVYFVQCSSCGGVVGVQEYFNVSALVQKQSAAIKKIAAALNVYVDLE